MERRAHEVLDSGFARGGISAEDREETAALEAAIGALANRLADSPVPDLSESVMARVVGMKTAPTLLELVGAFSRHAIQWVWTPRPVTIRLRPAYVMSALCIISFAVPLAPPARFGGPQELLPLDTARPTTPQVYVQFRLEAPGASHVALAGSFNGWRPEYELRRTAATTWSILLPLDPGIHDYAFIVDGSEWVADPHALHIDDGFGGVNSRIALPALPATGKQS